MGPSISFCRLFCTVTMNGLSNYAATLKNWIAATLVTRQEGRLSDGENQ
jgi:hypothetical protein